MVISAVNIVEGGMLTVLRDCLRAAATNLSSDWEIVALVHSEELIDEPRIKLIAFPEAKRSWIRRVWLEWYGFANFFKNVRVDFWFSFHDITPRVKSERQAVYCHNAIPFYKMPFREARMEPKLWLFNKFYGGLYRAFIHRNDLVIVQQQWLRDLFSQKYGVSSVLVAHPDVRSVPANDLTSNAEGDKVILLYPTLSRAFKNVEIVLEAMRLIAKDGQSSVEFRVTLDGNESVYSRWLYAKFKNVPGVKFIGRQTVEQMKNQYRCASAIVFPSKLETWGLPISEAKAWGKPLLVADLAYAHETVGEYHQVSFLPVTEPESWAREILAMAQNTWKPEKSESLQISYPYVDSWADLWAFLIERLDMLK